MNKPEWILYEAPKRPNNRSTWLMRVAGGVIVRTYVGGTQSAVFIPGATLGDFGLDDEC